MEKWRYNSNIFGIPPNDKMYTHQIGPTIHEIDRAINPVRHPNYLIYNIGRTEVYVKLKYGSIVGWHGILDETTVQPGEKKILHSGESSFFCTGLKVYNRTNTRAVVHCASEDDVYPVTVEREPYSFEEIKIKLLKTIITTGVKFIPYVGPVFADLIKTFWPDGKPSAWDQIKEKLHAVVDEKALQTIGGILSGDLQYYKERISALFKEIENGTNPQNLKVHFMNIAQDLVGFENKFKFTSDIANYQNVNQYILPIYSTFIHMKISYYVIGIQNRINIGLTQDDVESITSYGRRTLDGDSGAIKYISDMYQDRIDHTYSTCFAEDLYDGMMNVRTFIATLGLEYIPIWNHMLSDPANAAQGVYNDVISYSNFFGRPTPNLIKEAIPKELSQPLTPSVINGKRNKITLLNFYIWRSLSLNSQPARIGGITVIFENGNIYTMGTQTAEVQTVDFKKALLTKLEVYGIGAVDYLNFLFSDGRSVAVGEKGSEKHTIFELEGHHIVSLFLSSDNYSLMGKAANICVAYQLINL